MFVCFKIKGQLWPKFIKKHFLLGVSLWEKVLVPINFSCDWCWNAGLWWPWEPLLPSLHFNILENHWCLKCNFKVKKQISEKAVYSKVTLQGLIVALRKAKCLLTSCQNLLYVSVRYLDFSAERSKNYLQFESFCY